MTLTSRVTDDNSARYSSATPERAAVAITFTAGISSSPPRHYNVPRMTRDSFKRRPGTWDRCVPMNNDTFLVFELPHDAEMHVPGASICFSNAYCRKCSSSLIINITCTSSSGIIFV